MSHLELQQAAPVTDGLHVVLVSVAGGEQGVTGDLEVAHPAPALRRALHLSWVIKPADLDLKHHHYSIVNNSFEAIELGS